MITGGFDPPLFVMIIIHCNTTMSEELKGQEPKEINEKEEKKGFFQKLKEGVDEREEQLAILSTFVRLGILVWSGAILTLAYVDLPEAWKMPKQDLDPTFIASVFTGVLATFGVQTTKKGAVGGGGGGVSKGDMEALIKKAAETAPHQTITVQSPAFTLVPAKGDESKGELS